MTAFGPRATPAPRAQRSAAARTWAFVRRHALTLYALLVVGYLMLPIAVVILFSFNKPPGRFNYVWTRVHVRQLAPLERRSRHSGRDHHLARGRPARDRGRDGARDVHSPGHRPPPLRRPRSDERARLLADGDAGDRARSLAPDAVPEHDGRIPARIRHDLHRARDVHRQLRRGHREGAAHRLRPAPRGGRDGPRGQRG